MFTIKLHESTDLTEALIRQIIGLDRLNMTSILAAVGQPFPEDRRLETLLDPTNKIVLAFKDDVLAGYIDFCRDRPNAGDLYLSSIQIVPAHRNGRLFLHLLREAYSAIRKTSFVRLTSHVQKSNAPMIKVFRKLGLSLIDPDNGKGTFAVTGDLASLLSNATFKRIIDSS